MPELRGICAAREKAGRPHEGGYPHKLWNKLGITRGQGVEGALQRAPHWIARWVSRANRTEPRDSGES